MGGVDVNILIVEDGKDKRQNIKRVIQKNANCNIEIAKNYFTAKNKIIFLKKKYNLIVLDMFLPDASDDEERKGLAGKDLIFDIMNAGIETPVLVVTQYTQYTNNPIINKRENGEIPHMMENASYGKRLKEHRKENFDCTYYEGLHEYLEAEVPIYLGIVFYSNQFKDWENNVMFFLNKIKENHLTI